jgi:hypothetical protein
MNRHAAANNRKEYFSDCRFYNGQVGREKPEE